MPKSTASPPNGKAAKPYPEFPLFPHATGRWAKKVRGKLVYFGKVADDPKGDDALGQWNKEREALLAGRNPRVERSDAPDVHSLCNAFMAHKKALLDAGELAQRTYDEYFATCKRILKAFGRHRPIDDLAATDFQRLRGSIARQWGPVRLGNEIQRVRSIFKFGFEAGLIDKPPRFGPGFKKPAAKVLRKARAEAGPRLFTREQVTALLEHATVNGRAMIILALNGALGNTDLAHLPIKALDLKRGWLVYPRPKTGINRRIPLWPETVKAIRAVLKHRPTSKDKADAHLLFIGPRGKAYYALATGYRVTAEYQRIAVKAKVEGRTFYDFRRTFQTIAEGSRDLPAVQSIMGHAASGSDMSAVYRQTVDDERLRAVVDYVHAWLFPAVAEEGAV